MRKQTGTGPAPAICVSVPDTLGAYNLLDEANEIQACQVACVMGQEACKVVLGLF